jgi:hypothetical protein
MEHLNIIHIEFDLHQKFADDLFLRKTVTDASWALLDSVLADGLRVPYLSYFGIDVAVTGMNLPYFEKEALARTTNEHLTSSLPCVLAKETISFNPTIVLH